MMPEILAWVTENDLGAQISVLLQYVSNFRVPTCTFPVLCIVALYRAYNQGKQFVPLAAVAIMVVPFILWIEHQRTEPNRTACSCMQHTHTCRTSSVGNTQQRHIYLQVTL